MTYQLATAKVWNGTAWVAAAGGSKPWWETIGHNVRNFNSVTVTASATPHTKGAWTELVASTSGNADMIWFAMSVGTSGQDSATLVDFAIGAAGSEVAFASNVAVGSWSNYRAFVPFAIPSGSRISARIQSVVVSKSITMQIQAIDTGQYANAPTSLTTIGSSTSTSTGTVTTNNVWVQLIASTAASYSAVVLIPSASSSGMGITTLKMELGTGSAGSEVSVGNLITAIQSNETVVNTYNGMSIIAGPFAAGTRFSVRVDAGSSTVDACLIGIP